MTSYNDFKNYARLKFVYDNSNYDIINMARSKQVGPVMKSGSFYSKRRRTSNRRKYVARRPEIKSEANAQNVNLYGGTSSTGGYTYLLNGMATGTDNASNRLGRQIRHQSVEFRGWFFNNMTAGAASEGDGGFMGIVLDRQPNSATVVFSDIFDTASMSIPGISLHTNIKNKNRFKILKMENYCIGNTQSGASPSYHHFFVDLTTLTGRDQLAVFSSTSGGNTIDSGAVYFFMGQTVSGASLTGTQGSWAAYYKYTDE